MKGAHALGVLSNPTCIPLREWKIASLQIAGVSLCGYAFWRIKSVLDEFSQSRSLQPLFIAIELYPSLAATCVVGPGGIRSWD
jgi:hypothetical protein